MKKVSLTLTQVNYLIEESFNKGVAAKSAECNYENGADYEAHELDALKATIKSLWADFKFDLAPDHQPYFNAFAKCICILADWRANKVTLQPEEDKQIAELIGQFENVHDEYKYQEAQEIKQTFSDRLMQAYHEANATIEELVKLHNDRFVVYDSEDAFDAEEEVLTDAFMKCSTSIIVNTTFNDNETVWLLKLEGTDIHYISESGDIDSVDIQFVDDHTVCDIADWIVMFNLIEKAKS
jgi:hypothetical protein